MHKNAEQVISVDENKADLFCMVADWVAEDLKRNDCTVTATKRKIAVCNKEIDTTNITPCYKEEADDRIFLYV